ncbi:MAG: 23S rRNA (adenine(2030)-N(6))-methyltransferase RlmJ [Rickettsiaceae bacterium]|nr:23S rRNA (adenine(2030)-N(6))-methyltransferase RlmJ [Rickettsiaceae bacterium]
MNYRHIYHAGNFADLVKHIILISIISNLKKKEKPFHVLDAFAGIGLYDFESQEMQKKREFLSGASMVLDYPGPLPDLLAQYKTILEKYAYSGGLNSGSPKYYPGSPKIISEYLGKNDVADFCELHPDDFCSLSKNLRRQENANIHNIDGYLAVKSLLPPKEKRGMILIDPPFEKLDEFEKIVTSCVQISKHYSQGSIMIWHPIKNYQKVQDFYTSLAGLNREILRVEFATELSSVNLKATGVIIINPPYIAETLSENLSFLRDKIYKASTQFSLNLLPPATLKTRKHP